MLHSDCGILLYVTHSSLIDRNLTLGKQVNLLINIYFKTQDHFTERIYNPFIVYVFVKEILV